MFTLQLTINHSEDKAWPWRQTDVGSRLGLPTYMLSDIGKIVYLYLPHPLSPGRGEGLD